MGWGGGGVGGIIGRCRMVGDGMVSIVMWNCGWNN